MKVRPLITLAAAALASAPTHASVVLHVNNGLLTGASGVLVGGQSYDVLFVDGACASIFSNCAAGAPHAFVFSTAADALLASQALLDQVLLDGPEGSFDADPGLTTGCTSVLCRVMTPWQVAGNGIVSSRIATNTSLESSDSVGLFTIHMNDPGGQNDWSLTYAAWSLSASAGAAVPEPSSLLLAGAALAGLGVVRRRQC